MVLTPHLGASTEEAQQAVSIRIAEDMVKFLTTGAAQTAVNLPRVSSDQLTQTVPYQKLAYALGRLVSSLCAGPISQLDIRLFGRVAELDSRPITAEALVGLFSQRMTGRVNRVNAGHIAKEQGMDVSESKTESARDFVSLIEISAQCGGRTTTVAGTLLGGSRARLVRIDDYELEAVPEGHFLFTRHRDQPGVVGALGGILGRENINISRMQVGVSGDPNMAIALISTSASLSAAAMDETCRCQPLDRASSGIRAVMAQGKAFDVVCFDGDSTLSVEGIDELGPASGRRTEVAVDGGCHGWRAAAGRRVSKTPALGAGPKRPDAGAAIAWLAALYVDARCKVGAVEVTARIGANDVHIVSGGLRQAILPLAERLGIPANNVHAVDVILGMTVRCMSISIRNRHWRAPTVRRAFAVC